MTALVTAEAAEAAVAVTVAMKLGLPTMAVVEVVLAADRHLQHLQCLLQGRQPQPTPPEQGSTPHP